MQISAITAFSLIEFPGEISCIVFTPGCNMRCSYCHNSKFVLPEKLQGVYKNLIPEEVFFRFLETRKGLLTGVSICGGEPTVQKELITFCKKIKEKGFKVKLDTNGYNPDVLKALIEKNLVDYIAMDIKHESGKLGGLIGIKEDENMYQKSIECIMGSGVDYEFRTTVISGTHSDESVVNICKQIRGAKKYALQNYRSGNSLDPEFSGKSYTVDQLEHFKKVASKFVQEVIVRN